jgi:Na+/H+ antiporter NhaD/arsenite permease-like protein
MAMWLAIAVFAGAYVLIATERVHRVAAALGGAGIVVAAGILDAHELFYDEATAIDWNVIFLLFGMMVIVGVLRHTGVFEYVAIWAAKRAKGDPYLVMVLLVLITAITSAFLNNVTVVLLVAPVTLLVCERIGVNPVPYLIAEALASNIGGTATLIGDPPNLIVGSRSGLTFNDFVIHLAPIIIVLLVVFVVMCRVLFRSTFVADPGKVSDVMVLIEREAIQDSRLLARSLVVLAAVLVGFVLPPSVIEPSLVALLGAGVLVLLSGLGPDEYLVDIEWETLLFFVGLFVLVGALVEVGAIDRLADGLADAVGDDVVLATMTLLFASAVLSAFVDNIPYVATMAPVVAQLTAPHGPLAGQTVLWWALLLGADLGGNATAVGASANVVVLGIAKRDGYPISFWEFTKYGAVVALVTVLLCAPYLYLRYL